MKSVFGWATLSLLFAGLMSFAVMAHAMGLNSAEAATGGTYVKVRAGNPKNHTWHAVPVSKVGFVMFHAGSGNTLPAWNAGYLYTTNGGRFFIPNRKTYNNIMAALGNSEDYTTFSEGGARLHEEAVIFTVRDGQVKAITHRPHSDPCPTYPYGPYKGYSTCLDHEERQLRTEVQMRFSWQRESSNWPAKVMVRRTLADTVNAFGSLATADTAPDLDDPIHLLKVSNSQVINVDKIGFMLFHVGDQVYGAKHNGWIFDINGKRYYISNIDDYNRIKSALDATGDYATLKGAWNIEHPIDYTVRKSRVLLLQKKPQAPQCMEPAYGDWNGEFFCVGGARTRTLVKMDFSWALNKPHWPNTILVRHNMDKVVTALSSD